MEENSALKISIVTLSFNQHDYLKEAMESVLGQQYPYLEYIMVDPGSSDGSRELIQRYRDQLARIIFEKDKGAADGLNKGFALATGDVFGFLNADDILLPGSLRRVSDFFRQHPECDICFGNGRVLDAKGNTTRKVIARGFTVRRYLHSGSRWLQQSTFFRRQAFLHSPRFNPDNRTCWDGELFVHMRNLGAKAGYINADLGGFRIHNASISGTGRMLQTYREDCKRIFNDVNGRPWGFSDTLWKMIYRSEGLALKIASFLNRSEKRKAE